MKIYDKASWHLDSGEKETDVIERFTMIFEFLNYNNMLNDSGKELLEIGVDTEISLHDELVNSDGINFLDEYYDRISDLSNEALYECFQETDEN